MQFSYCNFEKKIPVRNANPSWWGVSWWEDGKNILKKKKKERTIISLTCTQKKNCLKIHKLPRQLTLCPKAPATAPRRYSEKTSRQPRDPRVGKWKTHEDTFTISARRGLRTEKPWEKFSWNLRVLLLSGPLVGIRPYLINLLHSILTLKLSKFKFQGQNSTEWPR